MEEIGKEEAKALLSELSKQQPPIELHEFLCELQLAMKVFFEGTVRRNGQTITLRLPNGQKFRITAELTA